MTVTQHPRHPPPPAELADVIEKALQQNFTAASASVVDCPDLRQAPFKLSAPGLSGNTCIGDVGARGNLFPRPNYNARYSLLSLAQDMQMSPAQGSLIGAGAAPFQDIGQNAELAASLSWKHHVQVPDFSDPSTLHIINDTHVVKINQDHSSTCESTTSTNCALMMNLFGSNGLPGPVLKVTARARTGEKNFTNCIRLGLRDTYGPDHPISLGGVFLLKSGKAQFHIMPDFPPDNQLPFPNREYMEKEWLTYHVFRAPIVCLTVFHSADPEELDLRMEHTHCFETDGHEKGGHYHYDMDDGEDVVEYEAYLNVASVVYKIP